MNSYSKARIPQRHAHHPPTYSLLFFLKVFVDFGRIILNMKGSKLFVRRWLTFLPHGSEYLHHGSGEYNANLAQKFILASQKFCSPEIPSITISSCIPHPPKFVTSVY